MGRLFNIECGVYKGGKVRKLLLNMSQKQYRELKKFIAKHGIQPTGKKQFYLLAQPRMIGKKIDVLLLDIEQGNRINRFLGKVL